MDCCEEARETIEDEADFMYHRRRDKNIDFSGPALRIIMAEAHLKYCPKEQENG